MASREEFDDIRTSASSGDDTTFVLPPTEDDGRSHSYMVEMEDRGGDNDSPATPTRHHSVAFKGNIKYVTKVPRVPFSIVLEGSAVCFALDPPEPICLSGPDDSVQSRTGRLLKVCNVPRTVHMFYVGAPSDPNRRRYFILVMSSLAYFTLRVVLAGGIAVGVGLLIMRLSAEAQYLIHAKNVFYGYVSLEIVFFRYAFPFLALAVYVMALGIGIFCVKGCRKIFSLSTAGSSSRGYSLRAHTRVRVVVCLAAIIGVVFSVCSWIALMQTARGFTRVVRTVSDGLVATVDEVVSLTHTVEYILREAKKLYNTTPPPAATDFLATVQKTADSLRTYIAQGATVSSSCLQFLASVGFMSAQSVLIACVVALTASIRRSVKLMRLSVALASVTLVLVLVDLSVRAFLMGVVQQSRDNTAMVLLGQYNVSAHTDSTAVAIVVNMCIGAHDNATSWSGASYLRGLLDDVITTKLNPALRHSRLPPITVPSLLVLTKYTSYVRTQVDQLVTLISDPARLASLTRLVRANITTEILPLVTSAVSVLSTMFSILECRHLHQSLGKALRDTDDDVSANQFNGVAFQATIAALLFVMVVAGSLAVHVLSHPRKNWYEPLTNRWFLFRAVYRAHRRLLLHTNRTTTTYCKNQWSLVEFLTSVELLSLSATFITFLQAVFLLLADSPRASLVPAIITLVLGSTFALLPGLTPLRPTLRRCLYFVSCALYIAAAVVCIDALDGASRMASWCLTQHKHWPRLEGQECFLGDVMANIELSVYLSCIVAVTMLGIMASIIVAICIRRKPLDPQIALHLALPYKLKKFSFNRKLRVSCRNVMACAILGVMLVGMVALVPRWAEALPTKTPTPNTCNGLDSLCSVQVHHAPWAGSHNTMSSSEDAFVMPNNFFGVEAALIGGVRALMIDVWPANGTVYLCHGLCELGGYPLLRDMQRLYHFLVNNPGEVVMVMLEQYVPHTAIARIFGEVGGLMEFVWTPPNATSPVRNGSLFVWPTLGELVRSGKRLLVFGDDSVSVEVPWIMYQWEYALETMYGLNTVEEVQECPLHRGKQADTYGGARQSHDNMILLHNIFLNDPVATPELADRVNHSPVLDALVEGCGGVWGRMRGTVLAVDFWSLGDVVTYTRRRAEKLGSA